VRSSHRLDLRDRCTRAVKVGEVDKVASLAPDAFRAAFRMHPAGVAVITADSGDRPAALTVSSLTSVSAEPPLMAFSASSRSSSSGVLQDAETVVAHLVGSDQLWLAQLAATPGADRFADPDSWTRLPTGEPVFTAAPAWIRGRIVFRLQAGESSIFVVQALTAGGSDGDVGNIAAPLVYHSRTWHCIDEGSRLD
jgi:flavin reductase (DIM6/NTAB) family NADH-FMN oxidoreductase RutF